MKIKNKRVLKNGKLAGYVKQKDGSWKFRFISSKKKGGYENKVKLNYLNTVILKNYKKLLDRKYKTYSIFKSSLRKNEVKDLLKKSEKIDNKQGLLDLGKNTSKFFQGSERKNKLYENSLKYQKKLYNKHLSNIKSGKTKKKFNDLNEKNKKILNNYKELLNKKYKTYSTFSLSPRKKKVKDLFKKSKKIDNKQGLLDLGKNTSQFFQESKKKNKLYNNSVKYQKELYNKHKNDIKNGKTKEKRFPKIYNTLKYHKDNVYFLLAHGSINPFYYFFVPHNLSIILTTTPGYFTVAYVTENSFITDSVDRKLLENLKPGISYKIHGKRNQLRFFKSGDIINNVYLNFKIDFELDSTKKTAEGGIMKYYDFHKQSTKKTNGNALLTYHISNDSDNRPSWPFITENHYRSTLHDIVKKFHGKKGHYVLIVGSCQFYGHFNKNDKPKVNSNKLKSRSLIYTNLKILKKKLNCFQDLSVKLNTVKNSKRLQNMSSTYKHGNCYLEIISKLRKNKASNNNVKKLENFYKNTSLFDSNELVEILKNIKNITEKEKKYYYKVGKNEITPNEKRLQRYIDRNINSNNVITSNLFKNQDKNITGGYIKIKNVGKRKIRYFKNGNKYYILNGRKVKI